LFGLIAFACSFALPARRRKADLLIPLIVLVSIGGYFYLNTRMATQILDSNIDKGLQRHGIFVAKFFNEDGQWLYSKAPQAPQAPQTYRPNSTNSRNFYGQIPSNVLDRRYFAEIYLKDIVRHPLSVVIGHSSPPSREKASSAHNYYLDLAYNFGILATLPLLGLFLYSTMQCTRHRKQDCSLLWHLAIIMFLVVIDSNLKVTLRQPYPGIVTFFLWGSLLASINTRRLADGERQFENKPLPS
jgi:hypothetical protein